MEGFYHSIATIWLGLWLEKHKHDTKEFFIIQSGNHFGNMAEEAAMNLLFSLQQRKTGLVNIGEEKSFIYASD